ncbi:IS110 family RNA-guided transposase [Marinobacterium jannaschii]|uniref:IS110 family transposase n=1 Tax=Marinobacterium jannaschii TaxID=64970 RepID=UPI00047F4B3F|nr:IS110 family transposase [Marinobacterium jannaschii]
MRFYTNNHHYYCGIDLHAGVLYVCILDASGNVAVHQNIPATSIDLIDVLAPFLRQDLVVRVECMHCWYWVSDLCRDFKIPFVLGHALYMRAIHGGKAKNDKIDSLKIARLIKGGMFPLAYDYPADMRATRDLLRRREHLMRKRAELLAHIKNTNSQYNLSAINLNLRYVQNRAKIKDRFDDPSVQRSMDMDLHLIDFYDHELSVIECFIEKQAKQHGYQDYVSLRLIPGIGQILALTILYEIGDIRRFERVQQFASYARLVKCKAESAGKRYGTSGAKIGNAHLKWAFSEAAVGYLCSPPPKGQAYLAKLQRRMSKAKAQSALAHKLGRAVFFMLKRRQVFDETQFLS